MVPNIGWGFSKTFVLIWAFALPGIWGVPVKLVRRGHGIPDYSHVGSAFPPSDERALQIISLHSSNELALPSAGRPSPFQESLAASGRAVDPRMVNIHPFGQSRHFEQPGSNGLGHQETTSSRNYEAAGAKWKSDIQSTTSRMRGSNFAMGSGDGVGHTRNRNVFGNMAMLRNQPLPENGMNPTHQIWTGTQGSFSSARPSGRANYEAIPAQRTEMNPRLSSQPVQIIRPNIEAPTANGGIVITDVTHEESQVSHQTGRPTVSEKKKDVTSTAESSESNNSLAPSDEKNSLSQAITSRYPPNEYAVVPYESGGAAVSKAAGPRVQIREAGHSELSKQRNADGFRKEESKSHSTSSHELNTSQMSLSSKINSANFYGKYMGRVGEFVTRDGAGPSHIRNENSFGNRAQSENQAFLDYHPTRPLRTGTQDSFPSTPANVSPSSAIDQSQALAVQRAQINSQPSSQHGTSADLSKEKSGIVITDISHEESLPSHQTRKPEAYEKQKKIPLKAGSPPGSSFLAPPDRENLSQAIISLHPSNQLAVIPPERTSAPSTKTRVSRMVESHQAGQHPPSTQKNAPGLAKEEFHFTRSKTQSTHSHELNTPEMKVNSQMHSSSSHAGFVRRRSRYFTREGTGFSRNRNVNSFGNRGSFGWFPASGSSNHRAFPAPRAGINSQHSSQHVSNIDGTKAKGGVVITEIIDDEVPILHPKEIKTHSTSSDEPRIPGNEGNSKMGSSDYLRQHFHGLERFIQQDGGWPQPE